MQVACWLIAAQDFRRQGTVAGCVGQVKRLDQVALGQAVSADVMGHPAHQAGQFGRLTNERSADAGREPSLGQERRYFAVEERHRCPTHLPAAVPVDDGGEMLCHVLDEPQLRRPDRLGA
jgi:hypothetical protein